MMKSIVGLKIRGNKALKLSDIEPVIVLFEEVTGSKWTSTQKCEDKKGIIYRGEMIDKQGIYTAFINDGYKIKTFIRLLKEKELNIEILNFTPEHKLGERLLIIKGVHTWETKGIDCFDFSVSRDKLLPEDILYRLKNNQLTGRPRDKEMVKLWEEFLTSLIDKEEKLPEQMVSFSQPWLHFPDISNINQVEFFYKL